MLDPEIPESDPAVYAGEIVIQPVKHWTREQQIALLDCHPMFTGRCPNCERTILQTYPAMVHWDCEYCGWKDNSA